MFWKKQTQLPVNLKLTLIAAFVLTMVLNGLAGSTTLLGGVNTADVSDKFQNLFTPAGFTFAIWGVIYLLVLGFVLYAIGVGRSKKSEVSRDDLIKITKLVCLNLLINTSWIIAWQHQILWLSVILIIALLVSLIFIVEQLKHLKTSTSEYIQLQLPFSIYFGWVSVATVANIATWLVSIQWGGFGFSDQVWMVSITILAAILGLAVAFSNRDIAYLGVFVWAFIGILSRHTSSTGYDGKYPEIIWTLMLAVAFAVIAITVLIIQKAEALRSS